VRDPVMFGTGQLPKFEDDQFWPSKGNCLTVADESAVAGLVKLQERTPRSYPHRRSAADHLGRESILDEKACRGLTALTPCFRAERCGRARYPRHDPAASVTKVELVSDHDADNSKDEHERMLACAEEVLRQLDLHYRVMTLCRGTWLCGTEDLRHRGLDAGKEGGASAKFRAWLGCAATFKAPAHGCGAIAATAGRASCTPSTVPGPRLAAR